MAKPNKKKGRMKIHAMQALDFPPEMVLGGINLSLYDNTGCRIEGPYNIDIYTDKRIQIDTKFGKVSFEGQELNIEQMAKDELSFTGEIRRVEYLGFLVPKENRG